MKIQKLFFIILFVMCGETMRCQNATATSTHVIEISDVSYSYQLKEMIERKPIFSGTVSLTIRTEECPKRIIAMRTLPYQEEGKRIFYAVKFEVPDVSDKKEVNYSFENINWGTYITAQAIFDDDSSVMADPIYSSNYLNEDDKILLDEFQQASLTAVQADDDVTFLPNRVISNCGQQGLVEIFNLQGMLINSYLLAPYGSLELDNHSPQALIIRIKFPDHIITKKAKQ